MKIDLHTHTTASDGRLSVPRLLERAAENGVQLLAITDHDTVAGSIEAIPLAERLGIDLIAGVEVSAQWQGASVHVVGLGVDYKSPELQLALASQAEVRELRARKIGERLAQRRCQDAYQGAREIAGAAQIGRPHFAKYMVATGFVQTPEEAFRKYLGSGKIGDVKSCWPELDTVVGWIATAGGIAVLAHPGKYKMTNTRLGILLQQFKAAGGRALEIVSGLQNRDKTSYYARLCADYGLYASCGSDFHGPPSDWSDVGKLSPMPKQCQLVTDLLS